MRQSRALGNRSDDYAFETSPSTRHFQLEIGIPTVPLVNNTLCSVKLNLLVVVKLFFFGNKYSAWHQHLKIICQTIYLC